MRASKTDRHDGSVGARGRRLAAAAVTAVALGVAAVGCGEDDPVLEGPDPDGDGEEQTEQGSDEGDGGGLY